MEVLLLLIYGTVVWLLFFKFKLFPWNFTSQMVVLIIPVVGLTTTILLLNIVAPSSHDVRVINYVVQIVPRVTGRVVEVPVQPNTPVKKGEILFRIDPTPFELEIKAFESKLPEARAKVIGAQAYQKELEDQIRSIASRKRATVARIDLLRKRQRQLKELSDAGAGNRFDLEDAEAQLQVQEAELDALSANESQLNQKLSARTDEGELVDIAQAKAVVQQIEAQIAEAKWRLSETVVRAPSDGTVVNLQLREGSYAAALPFRPVMSFVENEQWVVALYDQNELRKVKPGQEAEIALKTHPSRIIRCEVDSVVWASGQGQLPLTGTIPETRSPIHDMPEGRYAVRLRPVGKDAELFLAAGAEGKGAVYTDSLAPIQILRKVILRVGTKLDWLILKLH